MHEPERYLGLSRYGARRKQRTQVGNLAGKRAGLSPMAKDNAGTHWPHRRAASGNYLIPFNKPEDEVGAGESGNWLGWDSASELL